MRSINRLADLTFLAETFFQCETREKYYEDTLIFDITVRNKQIGAHLFSVTHTFFLLCPWSLTKHVGILKIRLGCILLKTLGRGDKPNMILTSSAVLLSAAFFTWQNTERWVRLLEDLQGWTAHGTYLCLSPCPFLRLVKVISDMDKKEWGEDTLKVDMEWWMWYHFSRGALLLYFLRLRRLQFETHWDVDDL